MGGWGVKKVGSRKREEETVKLAVTRMQFALLIAVIDEAIEKRLPNVVLELIELKHRLMQPG